ncbi:MAG: hypothetical protein NC400_12080 [Clostridium sp.]|nr:hypothetical protein [Clostridium sp.]
MKKVNIVLAAVGLIVVLFAIFCPSIIAEIHNAAWRIAIGLLGCFSFVSGICKIALRQN